MIEIFPRILEYLPIVLYIGTLAFVFSIAIGLIFAVLINFKIPVIHQIFQVVISFFRGIPTIIQIFIFYFGLPQLFPSFSTIDAITAVIFTLSLKNGAYLSEVFRSAFMAVDKGQFEACDALNLTRWQALRTVILPQMIRIATPSLGNYYIMTTKDTSLAFAIGVIDMLARAKLESAVTYKFLEAYLVVGIIYWLVTLTLAFLQSRIELYLDRPYVKENTQ